MCIRFINKKPKLQDKEVSITTNTTTNIQKDTGYDGLGTVEVTTNVQPTLQTKSVTITENGTTTVTPDANKDGLSSVEITTNVSGADLNDYFGGSITGGGTSDSRLYKCIKKIPVLGVSGTNLNYAFRNCTELTEISLIDTSSVTNMNSMFNGCSKLTTIPQLNTSSVTNMQYMFYGCSKLTTIPQLNTSSVTNMWYMFNGCSKLTTIPQLNTSSVTNMSNMFSDCNELITVPLLDTSAVTGTGLASMFSSCWHLSNESLNNILAMCINATSYTGTKTLDYLGLRSTSYPVSTIESLSNYQDFLDAGWTIGY